MATSWPGQRNSMSSVVQLPDGMAVEVITVGRFKQLGAQECLDAARAGAYVIIFDGTPTREEVLAVIVPAAGIAPDLAPIVAALTTEIAELQHDLRSASARERVARDPDIIRRLVAGRQQQRKEAGT
jgi:hypothetical protein